MKGSVLFLLLFCSFTGFSQSKTDSIELIRQFARFLDLDFTQSETDSMLSSLKFRKTALQRLHQLPLPNSLPYPFAFRPATTSKPSEPQTSPSWNIPANIAMPARIDDLAFYSVTDLASLIRSKKISSETLTRFFLDRLKKYNDTLHCVISFTEDIALEEARQADKEIAAGKYRGPLHGIPYGLKDLFAVKGTATTWGTAAYKDQQLEETAYVYHKLKAAGAVLCAKLSLGALAFNDLWFGGRTNNPWNLLQGSSGSSAGSAAATAAGLLPFAIGTETWGSIISPSARCGTTGLRPTFGSVSRSGAMVLSWSLDKIGPITRSAEDAAIVFDAIRGTDSLDHAAVNQPFNYKGPAAAKTLRVAYAENYVRSLPASSPVHEFLKTLKEAGIDARPVQFPDSAVYPANLMSIIINAESAAAFDELTRSNRDELIERQDRDFWPNSFRSARLIPAVDYINANRHRYTMMEKFNAFMQNYDVVIVPTFSSNQTAITNLSGHPALCLPIGFTQQGSPTSITLLGNLYDEESILSLASAYQQLTSHHKKHPPFFLP